MTILEVKNLKKYFPVSSGVFLRRTGWVYALDGVSFAMNKGETLGIVGESGCGKTTLGRCIMGLYEPSDGEVVIKGRRVSKLNSQQRKKLALSLQTIFQDPFESLDPRQTIKEILEEKYIIHGKKRRNLETEINRLIETVGLLPDTLSKFPHEFSGGQRQRIGIARAISLEPEIIVCDEPVSALDVSVQSKILNLLLKLQQAIGLTYLFISHDLSIVKHVSDKIAVMYLGKIIEMADANEIYENGRHPYTNALLSSIPMPDPESNRNRIILKGEVPSVENPPAGCRFNTRCEYAQNICRDKEPELLKNEKDPSHLTACHFFF
ncbi:ABC transporter ATP-binding protein [Desulfobacula phenolica]|uniref:Oligopeptide transport system ATP-binding protein n=1 Tax=Desulfobacula phenolica TaxID=90732 RepID=A0A1H2ETU7_9BACT|nr:ABC transporter ATP-binding protein [Desulfobacula phenolica]SDT98537.1 oligopeptide transport system ATP-binding protein [Desulfobacula phenolica]